MMAEELILSYQPQKSDYIKASRILAMKSSSFLAVAVVILLVVIASIVVLVVPSVGDATWRSMAFVGLATGVFYLINFLLIIPYQLSNAYKRNENLRKERVLAFKDSGVTMHIGENAMEFQWENFQRAIEQNGFYLLVYKADQRVYPFVPERAFDGQAAKAAFLALLAEKSIPVK